MRNDPKNHTATFISHEIRHKGRSTSTSHNPLEKPWPLTAEEFTRRAGKTLKVSETFRVYEQAYEETLSVTEEIVRVEKEIDERVKGLYGL